MGDFFGAGFFHWGRWQIPYNARVEDIFVRYYCDVEEELRGAIFFLLSGLSSFDSGVGEEVIFK
jgi:hypothetical protein